jgi:ArsR family transcriptional regulator
MDPPAMISPIDPDAVAEAREALPDDRSLASVVDTFRALANPTRARILYALTRGRGPLCVRDLAILVGLSESAVSHQLQLLRAQRLVKPLRQGTTIYYSVDDHHVSALFREAEYHADHLLRDLPDHHFDDPDYFRQHTSLDPRAKRPGAAAAHMSTGGAVRTSRQQPID